MSLFSFWSETIFLSPPLKRLTRWILTRRLISHLGKETRFPNQTSLSLHLWYMCVYLYTYLCIYIECIFFTEVIYSFLVLGVVVKNQGSRVGNGSVGKNPEFQFPAPVGKLCLVTQNCVPSIGWQRQADQTLGACGPAGPAEMASFWGSERPRLLKQGGIPEWKTIGHPSLAPACMFTGMRTTHLPWYVLSQHTHRRMRVLDLDSLIDVTVIPLTNMQVGMVSQSLNSVAWEMWRDTES